MTTTHTRTHTGPKLAFVDTETTGLDTERHEIWEVGLILRDKDHDDTEFRWFLPVNLSTADPFALKIGGYHERHPNGYDAAEDNDERVAFHNQFTDEFARLTRGAHLVGAVVSFDEERLRTMLQGFGHLPMWHYHLADVENLVAGKLGILPPWDSDELSLAVGVNPEKFHRHEALEDARWAMALWDAVMS
jgi:DNA polymerase III epsilon subunit-like protein